jgi:hypothetical protein
VKHIEWGKMDGEWLLAASNGIRTGPEKERPTFA